MRFQQPGMAPLAARRGLASGHPPLRAPNPAADLFFLSLRVTGVPAGMRVSAGSGYRCCFLPVAGCGCGYEYGF